MFVWKIFNVFNLNTSYVKVQFMNINQKVKHFIYLNTSYVKVQ